MAFDSRFFSEQTKHTPSLQEIAPAADTGLNAILNNINTRFIDPSNLTVSGLVLTVGTSVVTNPSGKKRSLPQINKVDVGAISGTLDFSTGVGTLDVETATLPTMTANYFVRAGVEIRQDKKIYISFGDEGDSAANAGVPDFTTGSLARGEILLQDDGTGGQGNFIALTPASITQFSAGAGGGGGGGGSTVVEVTQAGHGLSLGDPVYFDGTGGEWVAATATNLLNLAQGVIANVDGDDLTIGLSGPITLPGLTAGDIYTLQNGIVSSGAPSNAISQVLYAAVSTTQAILSIEPVRFAKNQHLISTPGAIVYQNGTLIYIRGGPVELDDGNAILFGSGFEGIREEIPINLSALEGSPVANTTYYLYADISSATSQVVGDTGREMLAINSTSQFKLLVTPPNQIDRYNNLYLATIRFGASSWNPIGDGSENNSFRIWPRNNSWKNIPEQNTAQYTTAATHTFVHGLSGKPDRVSLRYNDGSTEVVLDAASFVVDITDIDVDLDFTGFTFAGGDYIEVIAEYNPYRADYVISEKNQYTSAWLDSTSVTQLTHNLGSAEAIKNVVVLEHDVTADTYRTIELSSIVQSWDDTNINLIWSGFTPSATLRYQVIAGGTALHLATFGYYAGYSKFVGKGPGHYSTLIAALGEAVAGDKILVKTDQALGGVLTISVSNITIEFLPGTTVDNPITITGDRVVLNNISFAQPAAASWAHVIRAEGIENHARIARADLDAAGSVTDILNVQASAEFTTIDLVYKSNGATITNEITNGGSYSELSVRGA